MGLPLSMRYVLTGERWKILINACAECGASIHDHDLLELTALRFRKSLCREHFREALKLARVRSTP